VRAVAASQTTPVHTAPLYGPFAESVVTVIVQVLGAPRTTADAVRV
jgi:hypothetical protein